MYLTSKSKAWLLLTLSVGLGGVIWGYLLPQIALTPTFQERTERLQQQGIDPAALFYSEHPRAFGETESTRTTKFTEKASSSRGY